MKAFLISIGFSGSNGFTGTRESRTCPQCNKPFIEIIADKYNVVIRCKSCFYEIRYVRLKKNGE